MKVGELLLEVRGLTKQFGSLVANNSIDLEVCPGEIHALLGENGAGKSTLVKMLYGSLQPGAGKIFWRGQEQIVRDPYAARELGIGMVFQHFSLFESMTVAENIALALKDISSLEALADTIEETSWAYGLPLNPLSIVADLSVGERQRVEILRCLLQDPALIIMDEPTAVLTPQESELLFETLRKLAAEGRSILYISHRLAEVTNLCDTATILRGGKVVEHCDPRKETAATLASLMVGSSIGEIKHAPDTTLGLKKLHLDQLCLAADGPFSMPLVDIDLDVHAGEIVAIAGIAGNGQSELFDAISGERLTDLEQIKICGSECGTDDVTSRRLKGAAFVPEERLGHGAVPDLSLSENVILTRQGADKAFHSGLFLNRTTAMDTATRISADYDVRKGQPDPVASSLSGGNLQKFVVGREIDRQPEVLVVSQPTWGVDAGAAVLIRQSLIDLSRNGTAVLIISQDLDEIFEIADRVTVINKGGLSRQVDIGSIDREGIGLLMGGIQDQHLKKEDARV